MPCESGGIGRRAGLRILSRKGSGFKSRLSHQTPLSAAKSLFPRGFCRVCVSAERSFFCSPAFAKARLFVSFVKGFGKVYAAIRTHLMLRAFWMLAVSRFRLAHPSS